VIRRAGIVGGGNSDLPTIFNDLFTEASDTTLPAHNPDTGISWAMHANTNNNIWNVVGGTGYAATTTATATNNHSFLLATPAPTSADCEVDVILTAVSATAVRPLNLIARFQDYKNYYLLQAYAPAAVIDLRICKMVGGTLTELVTVAQSLVAADRIKFKLIGTSLKGYVNNIEVLSVTDSDITAAGPCGLGQGRPTTANADGADPAWRVNSFRVGEFQGVAGATAGNTVFYDSFTVGANTLLDAHAPDVGTSWAYAVNPGALSMTVTATTDACGPTATTANQKIIATCTPAPTTANVDIECRMTGAGSTTSTNWALIARYIDSSNYYALIHYTNSNTADTQIWKMVGGVATSLGTVDCGVSGTNETQFRFRLVGSTLTAWREGHLVLSATDSALPLAGGAGLGFGAVAVATDDINTAHSFETFQVVELS
jgi:hypothetical protein